MNTQPTSGVSSFETSNTLEGAVARTPLFLEDKDTGTWKEQKLGAMRQSPSMMSRSSEVKPTTIDSGREHCSFSNVQSKESTEKNEKKLLIRNRFNSQ